MELYPDYSEQEHKLMVEPCRVVVFLSASTSEEKFHGSFNDCKKIVGDTYEEGKQKGLRAYVRVFDSVNNTVYRCGAS